MQAEHPTCPKCGYDLYDIPEVRCPECGFGFDRAALRDIQSTVEWQRLAVAQAISVRASLATASGLPLLLVRLDVYPITRLLLSALVFSVAVYYAAKQSGQVSSLASVPGLLQAVVGVFCFLVAVMTLRHALAWPAHCVGLLVLILAWLIRLREWPQIAEPIERERTEFQRAVARSGVCAHALLGVATVPLAIARCL